MQQIPCILEGDKTIIVATGYSACSQPALRYAAALAQKTHSLYYQRLHPEVYRAPAK